MAQFDFGTIDTQESGTTLAGQLQSARDAWNSHHKGAARPSYVQTGMIWIDDSATPWKLNLYDGANDLLIGTFNATTHVFQSGQPQVTASVDGLMIAADKAKLDALYTAAVTLTNKRITSRINTAASSATPTPNADGDDQFELTAQAAAAAFAAPTGTPTDGQKLLIRIKDNGTARALTWNAIYRAGTDVALPATTVISKTMYIGFVYNSADSKWDLLASTGNI